MSFPATNWTMLARASLNGDTTGRVALEDTCRNYWAPVRAAVERRWPWPGEADDLTQDFFVHLMERGALRRADRERGRFRSYLLGALKFYLSHRLEAAHAAKRGGGRKAEDLQEWMAPVDAADPDFDRAWAIQLLARALDRLEGETGPRDAPVFCRRRSRGGVCARPRRRETSIRWVRCCMSCLPDGHPSRPIPCPASCAGLPTTRRSRRGRCPPISRPFWESVWKRKPGAAMRRPEISPPTSGRGCPGALSRPGAALPVGWRHFRGSRYPDMRGSHSGRAARRDGDPRRACALGCGKRTTARFPALVEDARALALVRLSPDGRFLVCSDSDIPLTRWPVLAEGFGEAEEIPVVRGGTHIIHDFAAGGKDWLVSADREQREASGSANFSQWPDGDPAHAPDRHRSPRERVLLRPSRQASGPLLPQPSGGCPALGL